MDVPENCGIGLCYVCTIHLKCMWPHMRLFNMLEVWLVLSRILALTCFGNYVILKWQDQSYRDTVRVLHGLSTSDHWLHHIRT